MKPHTSGNCLLYANLTRARVMYTIMINDVNKMPYTGKASRPRAWDGTERPTEHLSRSWGSVLEGYESRSPGLPSRRCRLGGVSCRSGPITGGGHDRAHQRNRLPGRNGCSPEGPGGCQPSCQPARG